MYVIAKNGLAKTPESQKIFREQLIPLLHRKSNYLHGEGISMACYALSEAEIWDAETWKMLADAI